MYQASSAEGVLAAALSFLEVEKVKIVIDYNAFALLGEGAGDEIGCYAMARGRYCNASARCGVSISSSPAKSAMVRASLRTR